MQTCVGSETYCPKVLVDAWTKDFVDARTGACAAGKDGGAGGKGNGAERVKVHSSLIGAAVVGPVASAVMSVML